MRLTLRQKFGGHISGGSYMEYFGHLVPNMALKFPLDAISPLPVCGSSSCQVGQCYWRNAILWYVSFLQVRVTVLDKNDSPPQFLDTPFVYNVSEDLQIGHTISTLRAHDPDTLGSVTFLLMDGHDGKFLLEPSTGKLILNDTLDRETKSKYELRIRVSDGVQYTEAYATIQVRNLLTILDTASSIFLNYSLNSPSGERYQW